MAVIRTKWRAVAAEIDSSGCKCQPVQTGKVERPSGNDSAVDVRTASEIPLQPDQSLPAAVPQVKVVLHKRGTRGEGWESCSWDEDERTKECIDFEGKPYEHADFVPATAVADAVRGHRQLLGECYEAIEKAIEDEDGLDGSEGAPLLKAISEILK